MTNPPDHTPKSIPPKLDPARERAAAATALIKWFNTQEINRAESMAIMSLVQAKIICQTTRPDMFELDSALDRYMTDLAHDINERLHSTRSDARNIQFKRGGDGK